MTIDKRIKLHDGQEMPLFGLGVYLSEEGSECYDAIKHALDAGYRLIDTAAFYKNEKSVGQAIRDSHIDREDIFVTTKLWNTHHGYDKALRAFDKSMAALGLDYVDLYLVHYPVQGIRKETWRAMEQILSDGRCRSIGVSNYMERHLRELLDHCEHRPTVNQIELHPYCFESRRETVELCRQEEIVIQAYSPLLRTRRFDDPKLLALAHKYQKTPAQILIRWALEENISVIPKSSNGLRIRQNADVFDFSISSEDMERLRLFNENFIVCWDPEETP
ncbi:MAG: aldo/keto reductase [Bacteroidota bacterium]